MNQPRRTIILAGSGSGGPVTPLLAIAEVIRSQHQNVTFVFIGTRTGPERLLAQQADIPFVVVVAGKLRRYASVYNILMPFMVLWGFIQSLIIIKRYRPAVVVGAGGFVQVPVLWAAWFFRVPVVVHQQDVAPSLANTVCAPIAKRITVSFEPSLKDFGSGHGMYAEQQPAKTLLTGNPVRTSVLNGDYSEALLYFKLSGELPVILVMGGGTGATALNTILTNALPNLLTFAEVIHITGAGKQTGSVELPHYHPYEFMTRMDLAYAAADVVVSRAGMATITELSNIGKPAIIIPLPHSQQEDNAGMLLYYDAAILKEQRNLDANELIKTIRLLLVDGDRQKVLAENITKIMPHNAAQAVAAEVLRIGKIV
jgi:UDP-N-acetylglucosamine--N-acetylmuramyl-(pentapeptide) pyrophosphoryl-undecaprenol N-acetylglucosamine transferase